MPKSKSCLTFQRWQRDARVWTVRSYVILKLNCVHTQNTGAKLYAVVRFRSITYFRPTGDECPRDLAACAIIDRSNG